MTPNRKKRIEKKDVEESQKRILSAKEKILAKKRFILKIVEKMIEDDVSKEWFLSNCIYLCHADFDDVVQERSIESLCGYPLCSNTIKQTLKQKYRISQVANKVYDVSERKYFCNNHCYKASNYIKAQLSPIPLYMRKEEKINVHLLSDCDNRGSAGEEIVFHHKLPQDEIHKVYSEGTSNNLQNLLNEEVKKCADSLSGLQIKEHFFEKQFVFSDETPNKSDDSSIRDKNVSYSESESDSDDSVDEKLFPSYDNESALSSRKIPVPEKIKKSLLIPPQKVEPKPVPQTNELSLNFVHRIFKDWITEDTLKYLMGEKYVYGVKADHLFKTMTETDFSSSEKLASVKDEYIKLCLKIDSLPDDDDDFLDSPSIDLISDPKPKLNPKKTETESNSNRVFKRRPKRSKDKNRHVTFAPGTKATEPEQKVESLERQKEEISDEKAMLGIEQKSKENVNISDEKQNHEANKNNEDEKPADKKNIQEEQEDVKSHTLLDEKQNQSTTDENVVTDNLEAEKETPLNHSEPQPEPGFPLVDSVSQNILRRQVLTKKLKSVYTELLPVAGLHYTDVRENVRKFVDTLSLTPSNIIYKPKEWKLISLVLFRILTRTVLKELHDEIQFAKLCQDSVMPITVDLIEIENLVCDLISTENIISIY